MRLHTPIRMVVVVAAGTTAATMTVGSPAPGGDALTLPLRLGEAR
ncbi:hypothetical protein [Streptomyces sp. NPDC002328]